MHAPEANSVQLRCLVDFQLPVTRIVFCKDGEELSTQQAIKEKMNYNYDHLLSRGSAGNFTCRYEIKDNNNWVRRSKLSPAQHLSVTGGRSSSGAVEGPTRPGGGSSSGGAKKPTRSGLNLKLLLGITIPAVLVLAVVLYLLGRKVVSLRRDHRERAWRGASCSPGDQIEYASVESRRSARVCLLLVLPPCIASQTFGNPPEHLVLPRCSLALGLWVPRASADTNDGGISYFPYFSLMAGYLSQPPASTRCCDCPQIKGTMIGSHRLTRIQYSKLPRTVIDIAIGNISH
nr:uncharacterized protein LOC102449534 isoform X2 [Pelodiscus sinensis]|eukprot:XP_025043393.1 uncharacterized protein LOC102449534 isoform X2 [Pelodiscus sinensis]